MSSEPAEPTMLSALSMRPIPDLGRAVAAGDMVRALLRYGLTQQDIGRAVGASARSVRTWQHTSNLTPKHFQLLCELRRIVLLLRDDLSQPGVGQWLRAPNRLLDGGRPLDRLEGDSDTVYKAAQAFHEGAYV